MRTKEQFEKEMAEFYTTVNGHGGSDFIKTVIRYMKSKRYKQTVITTLSEIPNYLRVLFFTDNIMNEYGIIFVEAFIDGYEFSPCPFAFVESKSIFKRDILPNMEKATLIRMSK